MPLPFKGAQSHPIVSRMLDGPTMKIRASVNRLLSVLLALGAGCASAQEPGRPLAAGNAGLPAPVAERPPHVLRLETQPANFLFRFKPRPSTD